MQSHSCANSCRLTCGPYYRMFLSRTVTAEVCMEAKTNEHAYNALKRLDKGGELLFELG
jgi:hypothetical protein